MAPPSATVRKEDYRSFYSTSKTLGQGAFGKVKLGQRKADGLNVAIKLVNSSEWSERERRQFENEVRTLFELNHPNIVRLYEVFEFEPRHYAMVMELASGGELFDRIQARGSFSEAEAAGVMGKLLSALAYMHKKKIAHRDLKPENIIYSEPGDDADVKLTDFGFAKKSLAMGGEDAYGGGGPQTGAPAPPPGALKTRLGSPNYVAPEILSSKTGYGVEVDIWSMGVILYILLCGYFPFYHENERELYRQIKSGKYEMPEEEWGVISESAKDLIRKMLVVNPKRRISAHDALHHPWLRPGKASGELLPDDTFESFKAFNKDRKKTFRGAVETVQAALRVEKLEDQMRVADDTRGLAGVPEDSTAGAGVGGGVKTADVSDIAVVAMQKARRQVQAQDAGVVYPNASVTFAEEVTGTALRKPESSRGDAGGASAAAAAAKSAPPKAAAKAPAGDAGKAEKKKSPECCTIG